MEVKILKIYYFFAIWKVFYKYLRDAPGKTFAILRNVETFLELFQEHPEKRCIKMLWPKICFLKPFYLFQKSQAKTIALRDESEELNCFAWMNLSRS